MLIKNVSLRYGANALFRKYTYLNEQKSSIILTLGAENLYTFTKYTDMDPEVRNAPCHFVCIILKNKMFGVINRFGYFNLKLGLRH
ncbi:MAG: hypothetical protein LBH32_03710 [Dysgonamonadaceae bacterium]|jgi:hypothetical protein|nr:hypothetical protein [Dysgonamonadaceae bacterium]